MIIDYSKLICEEGSEMPVDGSIALKDFRIADDIIPVSPVRVSGKAVNIGGEIELRLILDVECKVICARCLKEFHKEFKVSMDEMINSPDNRDIFVPELNSVDITAAVCEKLILDIYGKYLCREDCKGLCPICGTDRNISDCGCKADETDPRFAVLKKLLK